MNGPDWVAYRMILARWEAREKRLQAGIGTLPPSRDLTEDELEAAALDQEMN